MSEANRKVMVPPYCGLPNLSHQFPVALVDVIVGPDVVVNVLVDFGVDVGVKAGVDVEVNVLVDVDAVQDDKSTDAINIPVSAIQIITFFISSSY
jgi:hypothetical protein